MMNILPCIHSLNWGKTAENVMRSTMAQEVICIFHSLLMKQRLLGAFFAIIQLWSLCGRYPGRKSSKGRVQEEMSVFVTDTTVFTIDHSLRHFPVGIFIKFFFSFFESH